MLDIRFVSCSKDFWVSFPVNEKDSERVKSAIKDCDIIDLECSFIDGVYREIWPNNFDYLQDISKRLESIKNEGRLAYLEAAFNFCSSLSDALKKVEDDEVVCIGQDEYGFEESIGIHTVEAFGGLEHLDRNILEQFFDFEAYGRTLAIESRFNEDSSGNIYEVLR